MSGLFDWVSNLSNPNAENADNAKALAITQAQFQKLMGVANDPAQAASDRVNAAEAARLLKANSIDTNPINMKASSNTIIKQQAASKLAGLGLTPATAPSAVDDPLAFGATRNTSLVKAPVAGGVTPKAGEMPDITGFLAGHLGAPVTLNSAYRDPVTNAKVGGVSDSAHLRTLADGSPMAYDFTPQGMSTKDAATKLAMNLGSGFDQIIDEGDHVHISFDPKGRGQVLSGNGKKGYTALMPSAGNGLQTISPTVQPGDMTHFPGMVAMDPGQVGAMIPNARMLPTNVKLPKAPQAEMPAMPTPMEMLDKAGLLAPLAEAMKVKPLDHTNDVWDRVSALLQGAAQGATGASSTGGVGQLLLHAGAGAASGFKAEKLLQKGEQDKYDEMVRQANIALAQQGFNIDLKNVDVRNTNAQRSDTGKEAIRQTKFTNAESLFNAQIAQLNLNMGNMRENTQAGNNRDMARAGAVINATQDQAHAQNETNLGQTQLNLSQGGTAGMEKRIATRLAEVGIDPLDEKSPHSAPARQAAMGVESGQLDSALSGFAQDLVANGGAATILAPNKADTPAFAQQKAAISKVLKQAKKATDPQALQAATALAQLLNSDHKYALGVLHTFANGGNPTAKLILNANAGKGLTPEEMKAMGLK